MQGYIARQIDPLVRRRLGETPAVAIVGPRQCGKTMLAREIFGMKEGSYFDLEDTETPLRPEIAQLVLKDQRSLVVIDEFQRRSWN